MAVTEDGKLATEGLSPRAANICNLRWTRHLLLLFHFYRNVHLAQLIDMPCHRHWLPIDQKHGWCELHCFLIKTAGIVNGIIDIRVGPEGEGQSWAER